MLCLACGAGMHLREVVLADIPTMPGFERHIYSCPACSQVASRLVICRAKMPVVDPLFPSTAPDAPASNVQTQAAGSTLPNAAEKPHSAQASLEEKSLEEKEATDWRPTVEGAHQGPQRASSGIEGLGVGEDGRQAPQQTNGAQGASGEWTITASDSEFARSAACRDR